MARTPATRWTTDTDVHSDNVNLIITQIEAEIDETEASIPAIVNDLTTGGLDKALSAEMGKQLKAEVGDLAALPTIEKTNLAGAVAEVFLSGSSFKTDVAAAITEKGVETLATDTKETFVANIAAIQSGGGDIYETSYLGIKIVNKGNINNTFMLNPADKFIDLVTV